VWDTAGQEKYRTLPSQYYRGIQGILLVYDLTNKDSFVRIEEWFDKIEQNCKLEELVIALVGNKLDLEDHRQVQS
jgi:small GTP-binding protein